MFGDKGNRILRKCRSERKLRENASASDESVHHVHKNRTYSTSTAASSDLTNHHRQPRPSTDRDDGNRPRMSEDDWDPLRLHPPLDDARSPYIPAPAGSARRQQPPPTPAKDVDHEYGTDTDIDDIICSYGLTALRPPPPLANRRPLFQRMKTADMDIHEGFDFGFVGGGPTSPTAPTVPHHHYHQHPHQQPRYQTNLHSATSPVAIAARHRRPSTASSTGSDCSSIFLPSHAAAGLPITPLPMAPVSQQTRTRPPLGSLDSPNSLLKRGDWKRRGIIFISEEAKVTEDDCFEIP